MVFQEPRTKDKDSFTNYTRIKTNLFIDSLIKKQETNMKDCISSGARLEATPPLTGHEKKQFSNQRHDQNHWQKRAIHAKREHYGHDS